MATFALHSRVATPTPFISSSSSSFTSHFFPDNHQFTCKLSPRKLLQAFFLIGNIRVEAAESVGCVAHPLQIIMENDGVYHVLDFLMQLCITQSRRQRNKSASEIADPAMVSPLEPTSAVSPHASNSPLGKLSSSKGSPEHCRDSHSRGNHHPNKDGSGEKVNWSGLVDSENDSCCDPNDTNYDSSEVRNQVSSSESSADYEDFKMKARIIIEEYFTADDIVSTANELKDLGCSSYYYYFVKKLISVAMDMHDKEKEMAATLLSTFYAEVIDPPQVYKGFCKLLESTDDLSIDIPDAVDVLSIFVARAIVDEILPPAFLTKQLETLPKESKGIEVIKKVDKSYLSVPLHADIVLRKWGGSKSKTVEDVKKQINDLLIEYITSCDKAEAFRCIKDLKVPFFHHDIVKQAIILAMEKGQAAEGLILDLLKVAHEEGVINASQISKGFNRLIENVDDLSLDIPNARKLLQCLISKTAFEGWLCVSSLRSFNLHNEKQVEDDTETRNFKVRVTEIIKEYFLTGEILEVISNLQSEQHSSTAIPINAVFVKKLITSAMERKNREKEMASVLLSSLCLPAEHVVLGFQMLIESVDDTALDIPDIVEDLGMFLARAVVDEVLAPTHLDEIESSTCQDPESMSAKVVQLSLSLLRARLSGERILRCWGGSSTSKTSCDINDVKDKISKLLEEYDSGGDVWEACLCIKDLGMPFFHHEVVKKALVSIMEKKKENLWELLQECYSIGLITPNQMVKGFGRVADCFDDLVLDIPDVEEQFKIYVERAKRKGWLDDSFSIGKAGIDVDN